MSTHGSPPSPMIQAVIAGHDDISDLILVGEAATEAVGLGFSMFNGVVDAIAPSSSYKGQTLNFPDETHYLPLEIGGCPVRLWDPEYLGIRKPFLKVWARSYDCWCLDPELNLDVIPLMPNAKLLLEDRARIAATLYFDRMTDDELSTYDHYVRGF